MGGRKERTVKSIKGGKQKDGRRRRMGEVCVSLNTLWINTGIFPGNVLSLAHLVFYVILFFLLEMLPLKQR